jgi:predicted lipoprotein with Yx(FWY)xxD motif
MGGGQGGYEDYGYGYGATTAATLTGEMKIVTSAKAGKVLAASNGRTVYTYKLDKPNTATCVDMCASNWPPVTLSSGTPMAPAGFSGTFTLISRPDGTKQVALNGMPLYLFSGDKLEGETGGDGVDGVWATVKAP